MPRNACRHAVFGLVILALGSPVAAFAAPIVQKTAPASVTIIRQLSVTATAQMSFGKLQYSGNGPANSPVVLSAAPPATRTSPDVQLIPNGGETPAIRTIGGEPGHIYRVTTPSSAISTPGGLTVSAFTLWTQNNGDITSSHLGQLSASGADTLRIGATLTVPKGTKNDTYTANPTITISYE
jgi:hypothetical protein